MVLPALVLFVFELPNPTTLGVRYLLPSIALWTVVASPIALVVTRRLAAVVIGLVLAAAAAVDRVSVPAFDRLHGPAIPAADIAWRPTPTWTGGRTSRLLAAWSRGRHPYVAYFGPVGHHECRYRRGPPAGRALRLPRFRVGWRRRPATSRVPIGTPSAGCGPTARWAPWAGRSSCTTSPSPRRAAAGTARTGAACAGISRAIAWSGAVAPGAALAPSSAQSRVRRAPCVGSCAARGSRRRR